MTTDTLSAEFDAHVEKIRNSGVAQKSIVLQYVCLKNSVEIAVAKWVYGVAFRENPDNLLGERGSVPPDGEDCEYVNKDGCAYIKTIHVWMSDGGEARGGPIELPDGQCWGVVGWEISRGAALFKEDGSPVYVIRPAYSSD